MVITMDSHGESRSGADPYEFLEMDANSVELNTKIKLRNVSNMWDFWRTSPDNVDYPIIDTHEKTLTHDYYVKKNAENDTCAELDILVYWGGQAPTRMDPNYSDKRSFEMVNIWKGTTILSYHNMPNAGEFTFGGIKFNRPYFMTCGRESDTNWIQEFNPLTEEIKQTEFRQHVFDECAGLWDNKWKFYMVGGCEAEAHPYYHYPATSAFTWDVDDNRKDELNPLEYPRRCPTAVLLKEKGEIMVLGGFLRPDAEDEGKTDEALDTVEVFSSDSNTWIGVPNMIYERSSAAAWEEDGFVFVSGGKDKMGPTGVCEIKGRRLMDPWEKMPSLIRPRYGHSMVMINGNLVVVGGINDSGWVREIEEHDFSTGKWTVIGHLEQARYKGITGIIKVWISEPRSQARKRAISMQENLTNKRLYPAGMSQEPHGNLIDLF